MLNVDRPLCFAVCRTASYTGSRRRYTSSPTPHHASDPRGCSRAPPLPTTCSPRSPYPLYLELDMRATPHYPPAQPATSARADMPSGRYVPGRANPRVPPASSAPYDAYDDQPGYHYAGSSGSAGNGSVSAHRSPSYPAAPSQHQPQPPLLQRDEADSRSTVYTVQNTTTDTHANETEYGGVLTIRTTTVTRTITEQLVASDEDTDSSDEGAVHLERVDETAPSR